MSTEAQISIEEAFKQSSITASDYLANSYQILSNDYTDFGITDAIELSKVMAQDFHTMITVIKMQEIRDAINSLAESMESKNV